MGFKHATLNGPLCEEEITGTSFIIQEIEMVPDGPESDDVFGSFSGQVISIVKDLCKRAMLNA
jgi:translation elongation factor EF-G